MKRLKRLNQTNAAIALLLSSLLLPAAAAAGDDHWPQWRGPSQNGVSTSTGLPLEWSADRNIVWSTALPHWSGATPIIWGDRIFVTSPGAPAPAEPGGGEAEAEPEREAQPVRRGRRGGGRGGRGGGRDPGGQELLLFCVSKQDGSILWQHELDRGNELHMKGNNASPSPVTDGAHVWAVTGTGAVTALDMDGNRIWQQKLQDLFGEFGHNWGYASSPLLHDGMLVVEVLHGMRTDDPSYVVAFDAATGEVLWRVERPTDAPRESPDAYTTPIVAEVGGSTQIVISGGDVVTGHDPANGRELWRVNGLNPRAASNYRIVASPVYADGMVYAPTRVRPLLAVDVTDGAVDDESVAWRWDATGAPDVPTPACDGRRFYMVSDNGMVTCLDAKSGDVVWGPERTAGGTVSSSPLLADGRLYFTTEDAITVVVSAGDAFELLATNELDGSYTLSSPVASGDRLYIRTGASLYCIGAAAGGQDEGAAAPAATIPADADGAVEALTSSPRHGEWVDVELSAEAGGPVRTWVSYPERADGAPVVIVIHEIFGLTDWVRAVADQLAAEGFLAVAPDLLSGKGPNGGGTDDFAGDGARSAIRGLDLLEVTARLDAVRRHATGLPAARERAAVIGFCWGGSTSFRYATAQPDLDAAVVYYGTAPEERSELERIRCPVLGLYGGDDARVTATVEPTKVLMAELGLRFEPHVHPGAGHGFLRQQTGRDGANMTAATEAWAATLAFLRRHLETPEPRTVP